MARTERNPEAADFKALIDELEERIEALRHAYEKYFSGVDRVSPIRMHEKVQRALRLLERQQPRSTALRFRLSGLRARFVTYKHYWGRVQREMERGVSRRELLRVRRGAPPRAPAPEAPAAELGDEATGDGRGVPPPPGTKQDGPAAKKGPPPPPPPGVRRAKRHAPADPAAAGLDAKNLREVFRSLVSAKRAAGESTQGLTYAALVRKLTREAPKLRSKHKCDSLRFEVSTHGGKVKVRSVPG